MKKQIAMILTAAMTVGSLAGCGSTGAAGETDKTAETTVSSQAAGSTETSTAAGSTAATASTTTAAASGDITSWILEKDTNMKGEVDFWIPFKGDAGMDAMIADFNKTYPNIKVNLNSYSNNSDGNMSVNTAIQAGEVDVLASFGLNQTYTRWENGLFEDITDKCTDEGIDLKANWGTDDYKYEDKIYTLPCGGLKNYVSINMTDWKEAGLGDIPTEWTWDDYLAASAKMTKKDGDKVTTYGGSDYHSVDYFTYVKQQVDGTDRYYDDKTGLSDFDCDLIVNSLTREIKAENEDQIWFPKTIYRSDSIQVQTPFTKGETASVISPNMVRFLRDTENYPHDFITAFAPYPVEEKGQDNYMAGGTVFSHAGIATGCKDEAASWAFLKWYSTYGSKYLALAGHQSTWKGTDAADLVSLIFGSEEAAKLIDVDLFKRVIGDNTLPIFVDKHTEAFSDVTSAVNENAMYAFSGEMTPEEAMKAAKEQADDAIKAEQ